MNTLRNTALAVFLSLALSAGAFAQANDGVARPDSGTVTLSINDTTTVTMSMDSLMHLINGNHNTVPINITVNGGHATGGSATANNRVQNQNSNSIDFDAAFKVMDRRYLRPGSYTTSLIKDSLGATNKRIDEIIFVLNSVIQNATYTDGVADMFVQQRMSESGFAGNDEAAMRLARDAREHGDLEYVEDAQKTALAEIWRLRCKIEVNEKGIFILQEETLDLQIAKHGNNKERRAAKKRTAGRYERKKRSAENTANARDILQRLLDDARAKKNK